MINIRNLKSKVYKDAYDVVILAGQSNAVGYGKGEVDFEPDERMKELFRNERFNTKRNPSLPLGQYVFKTAGLRPHKMSGFYLFFGKRYVKEMLRPGRKLLFVRTAVGGTGFSDGCWGRKDHLYLNAVDMAKRIKLGNPDNKIVAILWHQGETDVINSVTKEYYKENFSSLIRGIRFELNMPYVPFIAGDMVEEWYTQQENAENVREAVKEAINENDYCGFVSSQGLCGNGGDDIIHFSGKSNEILGERYFEEFKRIAKK